MANKILYTDKEYLINDTTVPDKNKVLDTDMNEIKQVVNSNADELDTATNNIEANTQDISSIKSEQTTQNENIQTNTDNISALSDRVSTNENDISDLKTDFNTLENTVIGQAQEIAENTSDIVVLKGKVETNETDIANIKQEQTTQNTNITNLQNNKVDKVAGKGLSTNDFTDEYKNQVDTNTEDIADIQDEQTTQNEDILALQAENTKLKEQIAQDRATYPTTGEVTGSNITLSKTAEMEFIQPPLPRGNSEQVQYSGKNLLDKQYALVGYSINATTGQNVSHFANACGDNYILVSPNTTYTFSANSQMANIRLNEYDSNKTNIQRITEDNKFKITITTTANTHYIRWSLNKNNETMTEELLNSFDLQIEQGSTATDYEPYTYGQAPNPNFEVPISNVTGDVEVLVQNKNLWFGTIVQKGFNTTTGELSQQTTRVSGEDYILLNAGTYTINANKQIVIYVYDKNKSYIASESIIEWKNVPYTFTVSSERNIRVGFRNTDNSALVPTDVTNIQLEQGTTATTYTPHKQQTFTFPLGTQRMYLGDYLADDGIHHVRKQVVFDGSSDENWSYYSNGGATNRRFIITINDMKIGTNNNQYAILCNRFLQKSNSEDNFIFGLANYANIWIGSTELEDLDVAGFKAWLSTHNVTVEYELAEEEITPYTTEQQQAYNEIKQAISYEEQTNISGSSDESNPIFSVEAYQSTKLVLQEISNAVVALGGV